MPNPKLRILCMADYFMHHTDEQHTVTVPELIALLGREGFAADRRTVYDDMQALGEYGLQIEKTRTKTHNYYLAARQFELAELKLLVDAVQSAHFLSEKKSAELIGKLCTLTSEGQKDRLDRQVFVNHRLKSENERIYYNVDAIQTALSENRKLGFLYYEYTLSRALKARRDGEQYVVSPYLLSWTDDRYYLIADHPYHAGLVHFRVDKMQHAAVLEEKRELKYPIPDAAVYARTMFSMFAGEEKTVLLRFDANLFGVAVDRFGRDVAVVASDDRTFTVRVRVALSRSFYAYLMQFGARVKLLSPPSAAEEFSALLDEIGGVYRS